MKTKNPRNFVRIAILMALFLATLLPTSSVFADEGTPPGDPDMFAPVVDIFSDFAKGIIKGVVYLSGLVFIISVVFGASKGSIGSAIGNQMQVSEGVMKAISAVIALIFMLVAVPVANQVISNLEERVQGQITDDIANLDITKMAGSGGSGSGSGDLSDVFMMPELQDVITGYVISIVKALIGVGTIAFVVAVALGAFDTQLGVLLGGGMLASKGIMRVMTAVMAVIFLFISYPLSTQLLTVLVPKILVGIEINTPNF